MYRRCTDAVAEVVTEKCNRVNGSCDEIGHRIRTYVVGRAGLEPVTPCVSSALGPFGAVQHIVQFSGDSLGSRSGSFDAVQLSCSTKCSTKFDVVAYTVTYTILTSLGLVAVNNYWRRIAELKGEFFDDPLHARQYAKMDPNRRVRCAHPLTSHVGN
jgi:hypothetical protein